MDSNCLWEGRWGVVGLSRGCLTVMKVDGIIGVSINKGRLNDGV